MKKIKSRRTKEEKQLEKFLKLVIKLPHEQYFGIARILNVPFTETMSREDIEEEIKTITEELEEINVNLTSVPFVLEDISIEIKDTECGKVPIITMTDDLGHKYNANILLGFHDGVNTDKINILWIHLYPVEDPTAEEVSLTYHWFKSCLFEQALEKANLTIIDLAKILTKNRILDGEL